MADALPVFSACVGDATRDAGFEDTAGLVAEAAINCLAYYGITQGKTAERFDAGSEVTRSQMALFLHRAAGVAGLHLTGGSGAADFDDIADLDEERQGAIMALARNDILAGSGGMFRPGASITRAEMAVALIGFLRHAGPGLFHQDGARRGQLILGSGETLDHFADARRGLPEVVDTAISYAFELGITRGSARGASVFAPGGPVLRKNMASFITRTLAHTKVRPAGVTAQADGNRVVVSVRDAAFKPVSKAAVDGFYVASQRRYRAFDLRGGCNAVVRSVNRTATRCAIDARDPVTGVDGDVRLDELTAATIGRGVTVWVWTGSRGTRYSGDVDAFELRIAGEADAGTAPAATAVPAAPSGGGGGGSAPAATTTTTTTAAPATTTTTTPATTTTTMSTTTTAPAGTTTTTTTTTSTTTTTTTTTSSSTTTTVPPAAESLKITADDATVAATKATDGYGAEYYTMKFGDWSSFTIQLQHTDESDGDKVKDTNVGADGSNPVKFYVWQSNTGGHSEQYAQSSSFINKMVGGISTNCQGCPRGVAPEIVAHHNLKTDDSGRVSFTVVAPADPATGTSGTKMALQVRVVEEVNGTASSGATNIQNKRMHVFYVNVSEGARTTSGSAPTTTLPSGTAATAITVNSNGADSDKSFAAGATSTTFVTGDYGDEITITVQLRAGSADTSRGTDGTNPAQFLIHRLYFPTGGHATSIARKGRTSATILPDAVAALTSWDQVRQTRYTGADGSLTFSALMDDPDTTSSGDEGNVMFLIRAQTNAPGATSDLGTTAVTGGIVRLSEP